MSLVSFSPTCIYFAYNTSLFPNCILPEPTPTEQPLDYNVTKVTVTDMIHLMLALQQAPFHPGIKNTGRHKQMSANLPLIHLLLKPNLRAILISASCMALILKSAYIHRYP